MKTPNKKTNNNKKKILHRILNSAAITPPTRRTTPHTRTGSHSFALNNDPSSEKLTSHPTRTPQIIRNRQRDCNIIKDKGCGDNTFSILSLFNDSSWSILNPQGFHLWFSFKLIGHKAIQNKDSYTCCETHYK